MFRRDWRTEDIEVMLDRFRNRIRPSDDPSDSMPGEASAVSGFDVQRSVGERMCRRQPL